MWSTGPDNDDDFAFGLVSQCSGWSLGLNPGAKVSLVGLLETVAVGVETTGRVVLTGLCTPLSWRLCRPHEAVNAKAVPSGWVVYVASLRRDE